MDSCDWLHHDLVTMPSPLRLTVPSNCEPKSILFSLRFSFANHFITVMKSNRYKRSAHSLPTASARLSGELDQYSLFSTETETRVSVLRSTTEVRTNHSALSLPGFNAASTIATCLQTVQELPMRHRKRQNCFKPKSLLSDVLCPRIKLRQLSLFFQPSTSGIQSL